jgi:hypothetical protein
MPTKFHENLPVDSKVIMGDTDRQTDDLISLLSFMGSRLKIINVNPHIT